jgi:hypothetical protein
VNTLLVDPPVAPDSEQPAAADRQAGGPPSASDGEPSRAGLTCCNCGAPLREGQEWCLQCGAGQPGSIGERRGWGPLSTLALVAVLLTGAAAAAGAAALGSHKAAPPQTLTVAQAPAPATSAPTTSSPAARTPTTPATPTPKVPAPKAPQGETGANNPLFPAAGKPPKIPSTASTPKSSGPGTSTGSNESTGASKPGASEKSTESESKSGTEKKTEQPSAILLDTDAASTYNPYDYPEAGFGDPGLAIDGEALTAWTGQVQPSSAPRMAEGLLINLKAPTKLGSIKLVTLTPGMTVQLYGTDGHKVPSSITEPGWTPLSSSRVLKKKATKVKLHTGGLTFRFVVVWIVKAPASAVGTPQAPGHVDLNEVELFPPAS